VILADGNIGIGGDPSRLLARAARLVRPGGDLLVEVSPLDVDRRAAARIVTASGRVSRPFVWAEVGAAALLRRAQPGWVLRAQWSHGRRAFLHVVQA
jgi:hypothetical protein